MLCFAVLLCKIWWNKCNWHLKPWDLSLEGIKSKVGNPTSRLWSGACEPLEHAKEALMSKQWT